VKEQTSPLVPVLAALPVCVCMAILGLPAIGHGHAMAFRTLYFVACTVWIAPLALLQRALWRRDVRWLPTALALLAASYAMSLLNALLGQRLAIERGLETVYHLDELTRGLDGCWLALIVFCALHAVAVYYLSLQRAQLRLAQAQAAARDAELRALRLQVNPHFLFNSLNACPRWWPTAPTATPTACSRASPTSCAPPWPTTAATSTRWPRNWR
jgi:hypothetical protein